MVLFSLLFKAQCEGIQQVLLPPQAQWFFRVRCQICGEPHANEIYVNLDNAIGGKRQKTEKSFVMTCKMCRREGSINFVQGSLVGYRDSEVFQPVAQFEARGLEIVEWVLHDGFEITTNSGAVFSNQSLQERDWSEYDEAAASPVALYGIETRVDRG